MVGSPAFLAGGCDVRVVPVGVEGSGASGAASQGLGAAVLVEYIPLMVLFALALAVVLAIVFVTPLVGPKKYSEEKMDAFECGSDPIGQARSRFSVKFYLIAITFIVFDVEAVFVIPWAVIFQDLGWYGFGVMSFFLAILTLGLVYEWKSGGLEWD